MVELGEEAATNNGAQEDGDDLRTNVSVVRVANHEARLTHSRDRQKIMHGRQQERA